MKKNIIHKAKGLTVGDLKKALKGLPDDMPVYRSDHDHGEYETAGKLYSVDIIDQADADEKIGKEFIINEPYLTLRG